MRLFTGIGLPPSVVDNLSRLLDALRPVAHVKWSAPYNLHVTTKFIGEWPESRLEELIGTLRPLGGRASIDIQIAEIGWFPNAKSPRILYAGISGGLELTKLAEDTDNTVGVLGVQRETRKYAPHLTLARINDTAVPLQPLRSAIEKLEASELGRFTATNFHLYLSKAGPAGTIYTQLAEFPFSK